jgi:hypothetical protein
MNEQPVTVVAGALNQLVFDLIDIVPRLIIALVVWYLGVYLLSLTTRVLGRLNIKKTRLDDKAIQTLSTIISGVGRFILVLIILDYLGIGRTVVSAIATGFTYAVAIALGLAFGRALEPEAKDVVAQVKKFITK